MSLDKVNEGFEGDQKTLVKEKDVSLEEGQGGDGGGHQVTIHNDDDDDDDNDDNDDDVSLEEEQGGDSNQVVLGKVKFRIKISENALGDGILTKFGPKGPAKHA